MAKSADSNDYHSVHAILDMQCSRRMQKSPSSKSFKLSTIEYKVNNKSNLHAKMQQTNVWDMVKPYRNHTVPCSLAISSLPETPEQ